MNWFKSALTRTIVEPGSYYLVVDPVKFYEYKFSQSIPKGIKLFRLLPPTHLITDNVIVASAVMPDELLNKQSDGAYELTQDVQDTIKLCFCLASSPQEIIAKYDDMSNNLARQIGHFKHEIHKKSFLISMSDEPSLLKINNTSDDFVNLVNYGPVEQVFEKLSEKHESLALDSRYRRGKGYEMAEFGRYDNIMMFMRDNSLPIDSVKLQFLLSSAKVTPINSFKLSWKDCFLKVSPENKTLDDQLNKFNSLAWVRNYR